MTAGAFAVAGVSALITFALNPYCVLIVFASPATGSNALLPPCLTVALAIFPLSSLNLISNEFSSPAYT